MSDRYPPRVVVTFPSEPDIRRAIEEVLEGHTSLEFLEDVPETHRAKAVGAGDALLSWNPSREIGALGPEALSGTRLIQLLSAGANQVRFAELPPTLTVASNVGAYAEPMAEHVLAMALALAKRLPQKHAELARGEFLQGPPTRSMAGSVCGILGFGGIGRAAARLFRPLGVAIHAVNTSGRTEEDVEFIGTLTELDRVLDASDVLVITLPLNRATDGLIGARELDLMKPDAILVNVARGAIVQQRALYEHLRRNPEFMAGIDAWWVEPFGQGEFRTDVPFFELPNVLGSPHNSAIVPGILAVAAGRAAQNVARYLRGEPVAGLVVREDYEG